MADAYPELREHAAEIERVVKQEEERFRETLARGLKVFEELAGKDAISADDAFVLATTYGFPIELTQELAEERGQAVDIDRFRDADGGAPRGLARRRRVDDRAARRRDRRAPRTGRREFVGYEKTDVLTAVIATRRGASGSRRLLKLEESPFYAAGGGQVSDDGYLQVDGEDARYDVVEVLRFGDDQVLIVETGDASPFADGTRVHAVVDVERRASRRWPTTPRRTSCTPRCARCSATTSSRPARPCGPTSCASTSRTPRR